MGVPRFFLWLYKKYKHANFIIKDKIDDVDSLLIDANCLLHPQCFKILHENKNLNDKDELERKMINQCCEYLKYLIDYTKPRKEVYIAIDGVAPIAKIKQQRQRRFRSAKDKILYDNLKKKHNKEISTYWNNSAITPGTKFMEKLTFKIIEFCKNIKDIKIHFSTAYTPSEGEHKLLQHIRDENKDYKYAIYGLDADLIFLALSTFKENIYLLREAQEFGSDADKTDLERLNFVSIDILSECIFEEIRYSLCDHELDRKLVKKNVIRDFVFICYFLGNDFLPHIPSIDISCFGKENINGLDLLIQAYGNTYDNIESYIVTEEENGNIIYDTIFLQMFLDYLASFESDFFKNLYNSKKYFRKLETGDSYDKEVFRIENLQFKINDDIQLGKDNSDEYKFRYYTKYYFTDINQQETIKDACFKYIEGLLWVANYYFKKCPSWEWHYTYDHAPFISDLADNLKRFNLNDIKFSIGKPLRPIEQLFTVLPKHSDYLVPDEKKWLMNELKSPLIHLYPNDFEIDLLYKSKYWQGIPYLPDIDLKLIKNTLKNYKEEYKFKNEVLLFN